ncbi:MAG TPA: pseudouridine synthase, partial [Abditibacteriaceae bacterium]|nr:pseudouridine synthase [Abditibacteriaceae bacterium]
SSRTPPRAARGQKRLIQDGPPAPPNAIRTSGREPTEYAIAAPQPPSSPPSAPGGERLQKILARAGVASRRAAEALIEQGQVSVNGHIVTELGVKADAARDNILVAGRPLKPLPETATVVLLHKPTGVVTTKDDPEGRPTVMQLLPAKYRHLHPVGRLDYDTAGVLLLTDDGSLTHLLTHPSHGVDKVYWARVRGEVKTATLKRLESGVPLEDGMTAPCKARVRVQTERNALVEITLREGRKRQVRRMLEVVGHPVSSLRRVRFAGLGLEGLPAGGYRVLLPGEVHLVRKLAATKVSRAKKTPAHAARAKPPVRSKAKAQPASRTTPAHAPTKKPGQHPLAARVQRRWGE